MELAPVYILLIAFIMDALLGDPRGLPHLIVFFGKAITKGERLLNTSNYLFIKGLLMTTLLVMCVYILTFLLVDWLSSFHFLLGDAISTILLFYCLANRTLIKEGQAVFMTLKGEGLEAGRKRLSWIVGRDTSQLNEQQIRTATLETLSENLSDGVIAPLCYYFLLGIPGAVAYKMVNTLDSMIGYKSDRYIKFGKAAAKLDDIANYLPSRITALLMLLVSGKIRGLLFVFREGKKHASPNAGYPEAALAFILNCRFGGPNVYHGELVEKPFIGDNPRTLKDDDLKTAVYVNWASSLLLTLSYYLVFYVVYGAVH